MCCPISAGRRAGKAARTQYRGGDGPLSTRHDDAIRDPIVEAFAAAGARGRLWLRPMTYNGATAGRLRAAAGDDSQRPALQRRGCVFEAGAGARQSHCRGWRARQSRSARRSRVRSASNMPPRRRYRAGLCGARGDSGRRRDQLAAALDAVGHRRSRRVAQPWHRNEGAARRRRQKSAGSPVGRRRLHAARRRGSSIARCGSTES